MKKPLQFMILSSSLCISSFALAASSNLDITVQGVRDNQGAVRADIFNSPEGFPKATKAMAHTSAPAKAGTVSLQFSDLAPGKYAVIVYHDENNDEQMDKRFGMIPIEGYGLSNNVRAFAKPSFDECAFDIPATKNQTINLRY